MRVSTRDNNFINSKGDVFVSILNVKNRQIGATGFFRYAGISPDKGRYKAFYDPQSGEIAVPLG